MVWNMRTSPWVTQTLASLSLDEKIGQLLHPNVRPAWTADDLKKAFPPVRVGGAFIFSGPGEDVARVAGLLQDGEGLPLVISSDLESGAGRMVGGATLFPDLMSVAAAGDTDLARLMGEATAVEGRAYGIHWTFGPVIDLNVHPGNPIANTRGLSDNAETTAKFASALVEGMQAHGMAATVKHFPGDGWDDRDQHLATSINPLTKAEWERHVGLTYRRSFAAGCWTTMVGHIALPSVDAGDPTDPAGPPPGILSKKITTDLLRGELGFDGLVVSDAIEMNGSVSRVASAYELVVKLVNAGNDMLLFCNAKREFENLKKAVANGDVSVARIDEAVTRILQLKERLGFPTNPASARPAKDPQAVLAAHHQRFSAAARGICRKALTLVRADGSVPLALKAGDRVLTVHLRSNPEYHTDALDGLLKARGIVVDRRTEDDSSFTYRGMDFSPYKAVLFLWTIGPTWGTSFIRPAGPWMRTPWHIVHEYPGCPLVHVSFGTPYLIHDVPWAQTLVNAYSPDPLTQEAVVEWLFGGLQPVGTSPVDLDRPAKVRALVAREFGR